MHRSQWIFSPVFIIALSLSTVLISCKSKIDIELINKKILPSSIQGNVFLATAPEINSQNNSSYTVNGTCSPHNADIQVLIDGTVEGTTICSNGSWNLDLDLTLLTDGPKILNVKIAPTGDFNLSNVNTTSPANVTKDATAPSLVTPLNDGIYFSSISNSPALSWPAGSDAGSGISKYQISLGTTPGGNEVVDWIDIGNVTTYSFSALSLSEGASYYPSVRLVDLSNNISSPINGNGWIVDTIAPDSSLLAVDDQIYSNSATMGAAITWAAATDLGGSGIANYEVAIGTTSGGTNTVGWTNVGNVLTATIAGTFTNGVTYYGSVRAKDNAGNISSVALGNGWIVDSVGPIVGGMALNDQVYSTSLVQTTSITWNAATDTGSGILKYEIAIGTTSGGTNVINWTNVNLATSAQLAGTFLDGTVYYASVRVYDNAGNINTTLGNGWRVDITPPNMTAVVVDDGLHSGSLTQTSTISWNAAAESGSGINRYELAIGTTPGAIDTIGWTSTLLVRSTSLTGTLTAGLTYYASVRCVDNAGNMSTVAQGNGWILENLNPIANPDFKTLIKGDPSGFTFNPIANDSDPENDALTIQSVGVPAQGTAVIVKNQIYYTITNAAFVGTDSFSYTIVDVYGATATSTIEITIKPITNWLYRKKITISSALSPNTTLSNFPFLLKIVGDFELPAKAQANGNDIVFTQADGVTPLKHEVENYSFLLGDLEAWIKIPSVPMAAAFDIYMYYGEATALSMQHVQDVFDNNHLAVWHMNDDPSIKTDGNCIGENASLCDSTVNRRHAYVSEGTMDNSDLVTAQISKGLDFDSATKDTLNYDCVGCPSFPLTISTWFNAKNLSGILVTYGGPNITIAMTGSYMHVGFSSHMRGVPIAQFTTNTWYNLTVVYTTATNIKAYVNGIDQTVVSNDYWNASGNHMGSRNTANCCGSPLFFNGKLDETRILSTALTSDYIKASYDIQNNPLGFVTIGAEE